jgi:thiosulfate dehydrogenase [quinone] large subunit
MIEQTREHRDGMVASSRLSAVETGGLSPTQIPEPALARFLFADTRLAWFWLIVRVYTGWQWLDAGWGKIQNPAWFGANAGSALTGFVNGALQKSTGDHPDVNDWYAAFLQAVVLPHAALFSNVVAVGEVLVGLGLIFGALTGIAAFFGTVMNANYLFAGTLSTNPLLFILGTWIVLAWRVAGWYGLDRWLLPLLGTPWAPGRLKQKT